MSQSTQTKKPATVQRFSKAAFIASASNTKERLEYEVVLEEDKSYSKAEAAKAVDAWKNTVITEEAK